MSQTWFLDAFPLLEVGLVNFRRFPPWRQQTGSGFCCGCWCTSTTVGSTRLGSLREDRYARKYTREYHVSATAWKHQNIDKNLVNLEK